MRTDRRMDWHDKANSRFSQIRERAEKFYVLPTQCICVFGRPQMTMRRREYVICMPGN
jgi:hypothetical protein